MIPKPFVGWTPKKCTPREFDAVLPPAMSQHDSLAIPPEVRVLASRHDLLPPIARNRTPTDCVFQSRCYTPDDIIPTFMSQYGSQHDLPLELLKEKGFMIHFLLPDEGPVRFWHPLECLFLHGACGNFFLSSNWEITRMHLGNQICVPHALLLISNALALIPSRCVAFTMEDLWTFFQEKRLTLQRSFLRTTDVGMFVSGSPIDIKDDELISLQDFFNHIQHDRLAPGKAWSLKGFVTLEEWLSQESDLMFREQFPNEIGSPLTSIHDDNIDMEIAEDEHGISPTLDFIPLLRGLLCTPTKKLDFWFSAALDFSSILGVWKGFELDLSTDPPPGYAISLIPCNSQETVTSKVLIRVMHQQIVLFPANEKGIQEATEKEQMNLCDQFGLSSKHSIDSSLIFTVDFEPSYSGFSPQFASLVLAALDQSQISTQWDPNQYQLQICIQGPTDALRIFQECFQHLWTNALQEYFGIALSIQSFDNSCLVSFVPQINTCPLPVTALQILLATHMFRHLIEGIRCSDGTPVFLKWMGRPLWHGTLPNTCTVKQLMNLFMIAAQLHTGQLSYALVQGGKRMSDETLFHDCQISSHRNAVTCHIILSLHGGGAPTGTKSGFKTQIKNSLAATLLQEGYELSWVGQTLDKLVDVIGVKNLTSLSAMAPGPDRLNAIRAKIREASIELPKIEPKVSSQQALQSKLRKKQVVMPCPSNYQLDIGFVVAEDGSSLAQLSEFRGGCQGVYMCNPEFALPWLRAGDIISPDELILLICGEVPCDTKLPFTQITVPCTDEQNRQVLMSCVMVQLGQKKGTVKKLDSQKFDVACNSVVALTLWQHDWEQQWPTITSNPYQFVKQLLKDIPGLVSIWGKAYRKGRSVATPSSATSVQMHCTITDSDLTTFLGKSGFNGIWCIPKTVEGRPCPKWKLLWLDPKVDMQQASILAAKISSAGLARNQHRLARRVSATAFEAAWKTIFPGTAVPESVDTKYIYKVESLPFGITSQLILDWSKHIGWSIKPLRAVGPRAWVIGTSEPPLSPSLSFNNMPLLIRLLPPRQVQSSGPIIAGPRPSSTQMAAASTSKGLTFDPWANWSGPRISPSVSNGTSSPSPLVSGPIESKFQEQNQRWEQLEKSIAGMQKEQGKQADQILQTQQSIQASEDSTKTYLDQRLTEVHQTLTNSFTDALKVQTRQFDSNLQEIKALLLSSKRKKPDGTNSDASMSPS